MDYAVVALTILAYLLGLAFAGSFLGRRYMGYVDILLHRLLRKRVTWTLYLYWRYFCGIPESRLKRPPSPLPDVKGFPAWLIELLKLQGIRSKKP